MICVPPFDSFQRILPGFLKATVPVACTVLPALATTSSWSTSAVKSVVASKRSCTRRDDLGLGNGRRGGGPARARTATQAMAHRAHQSGSIGGARTSRGRPPSLAVTTPSRSMRSIMRAARL